ncbi:MAG: hypothetical protein K2X81_24340 [Candidatus Obscuribacterales bacterium]|nr:hypothetical protein [Candidatus Obscuribacterales bacterium]
MNLEDEPEELCAKCKALAYWLKQTQRDFHIDDFELCPKCKAEESLKPHARQITIRYLIDTGFEVLVWAGQRKPGVPSPIAGDEEYYPAVFELLGLFELANEARHSPDLALMDFPKAVEDSSDEVLKRECNIALDEYFATCEAAKMEPQRS